LKIGRLSVSLAEKRKAPPLNELGATGTTIFSGVLSDSEYNTKLQAGQSYDEYDRMRNDGTVRAGLTAIKLPLLNATWGMDPASDSAQDREIAERLEQALIYGMTIPFKVFLRQALLMLDYGSMPFEKVWEMRDGLVMLRKIAPRMPKTVQQWLVDETGGLRGITQATTNSGGFQTVEIPVEKLLAFVNELEGSNFRGVSLLRSAWKHYFYKDNFYRVQAIAIEKRAVGVDVGTLKGDAKTPEKQRELERALMTLHAHEKQFFTEVDDQFGYRLETGGAGVLDPMSAIEHHDLRILRSILAEFIGMGAGSTGSLAMHGDKTSFFLMALGGIGSNVIDTVSSHLIKQWVDYNWSVDAYPRLRHSRLEVRDLASFANAVLALTQAGALTPDAEVERESRTLLNLPPQADGAERTPPPPTLSRQIEKLIEIGKTYHARRDTRAIADVAVPFKRELIDDLTRESGDGASAAAEAAIVSAHMKSAFVKELVQQIRVGGEFEEGRLRGALLRASRERSQR
jgi:phage gp29-like protein